MKLCGCEDDKEVTDDCALLLNLFMSPNDDPQAVTVLDDNDNIRAIYPWDTVKELHKLGIRLIP